MPKPAPMRKEVLIQGKIIELINAFNLYVAEHCNEKGVHQDSSNLTPAERRGRQEIRDGIENHEWVLYATDKSGKLVLDTHTNFINSMKPHFETQEEVTISQVHEKEKILNDFSSALSDIVCLGANAGHNQAKRCHQALVVNKSSVPLLGGLRKDHKEGFDPVLGPKCRPLCDGKVGPNAPLANMTSMILKTVRSGVADDLDTEVLSTEELQHHIDSYNSEAMGLNNREYLQRGHKLPPPPV